MEKVDTLGEVKAVIAAMEKASCETIAKLSPQDAQYIAEATARAERLDALFAKFKAEEAEARRAEAEARRAEAEARRAEAAAEAEARRAEAEARRAEAAEEAAKRAVWAAEADERGRAFDERMRKLDEKMKESQKKIDSLYKSIKESQKEICGISKSNGMMSEAYFFSALEKTKTVGGIHFDEVEQDVHQIRKYPGGKKVQGQYDVVLYNDEAVCIVEVKYRLRKDDIEEMVRKHPDTFRKLYPYYDNYKIYLTVAGMALEKEVEKTAKELGVGVLRVNGDAIEVDGGVLKAF